MRRDSFYISRVIKMSSALPMEMADGAVSDIVDRRTSRAKKINFCGGTPVNLRSSLFSR